MKIPRRTLLKQGALLTASMTLPAALVTGAIAQPAGFSADGDRIGASLVSYFSKLGFRQVTPASLVTDNADFNGGLRYDDTGVLDAPATFVIQPCARTTDIAEKHRRDVLPLFHIFRFDGKAGDSHADAFTHIIAFLTGPLKLDPARLAFVSISPFETLRPHIRKAGVDWERQVVLRDPDAAMKAGDGSGIFRHPGDSTLPALPTAGIYYWVGQGAPAAAMTHPLPGAWTEIGELIMTENGAAFGLGVERLQLAATDTLPTWSAQLTRLNAQIERDSPNGSVPPGKALFKKG